MKGKKMVFAVILALIVCLVLIPTCAFADDDQGLSGDNSMAGSSTMDGGNPSGAPDGGNDNGADSGSDDANQSGNVSESGNDGNVGGSDAGTPGGTEGGTENGTDSDNDEDENKSESGDKEPAEEESDGSGDEDNSEDSNVTEEDNAEEAVQLTASAPAAVYTEPTLQDQIIKAGAKETTIVLDRDYTESITIGKDQNIILDLNGWTLTYDSNSWNSATILNNGNLTIKDSVGGGKIDNTDVQGVPIHNTATGNLTIESGTITRSKENGIKPEPYGEGNSCYTIWNEGTMTIKGGRVENNGSYSSNICNGYGENQGTLTIEDGEFIGGKTTVNNKPTGTLIINGGTFTNESGNVVKNENSTTLNGGTFNGTIKNISNNFNVGAGIFTDESLVNEKIDDGAIVTKYGDQYGINDAAYELAEIAANNGDAIEIVSLPKDGFEISDIPEGVKFVNNSGKTLIINGVEVKDGTEYTVPASDPKPAEDNKTETSAAPTASARLYAKYIVLEGKGQQWTDGDLEFVLNSNAVVKVLIDGVEVEFTVAEDGTVTIASAVIEALEAGTHEIQFIFADGSCMTTFTK